MRIDMRAGGRIGVGLMIAALTASAAGAQQRQLFHWSGRVDQQVQLTMTGRNVTSSNMGPNEPGKRNLNVMAPMPRMDGMVSVQILNGRGTANVVQQPTAQNGYTAIVSVRDPQGGSADYSLNVFWQPASAGEVGAPFHRAMRGNRLAMTWSGDVDDALQINLGRSGVNYHTIRGQDARNVQASFNGIPTGARELQVSQTEGRGTVVIVRQPTPENGYTATLRINDPQPGYGHYSFQLYWR